MMPGPLWSDAEGWLDGGSGSDIGSKPERRQDGAIVMAEVWSATREIS
jgi:hypothetical protein